MLIDKTDYNTIHQWNLRNWVKTGICEFCNLAAKTQWSNKTGLYLKGVKEDWQELCVKCHNIYDKNRSSPELRRKLRSEMLSCKFCSKKVHKIHMRFIVVGKHDRELCNNCLMSLHISGLKLSPKDSYYKRK